jgi:hypothetical protein
MVTSGGTWMKIMIVALFAGLWLSCAAMAQDTSLTTITPAQEVKIREFVASEKRTSVAVPASFRMSVGAEVSQLVELYQLDADVGLGPDRYTIIGGKTVLVDPSARKIVRIMD